MKVLKIGIPPINNTWIENCRRCNSELEVSDTDVHPPVTTRLYFSAYDCPICGCENEITFPFYNWKYGDDRDKSFNQLRAEGKV